jgi:hypothetical protein
VDQVDNREVSEEEAKAFANSRSILYIETSVKNGTNIPEVLSHTLMKYYNLVGRFATTEIHQYVFLSFFFF